MPNPKISPPENFASPKPPSRFHELARNRDAGHDAMQAEFLTFLRSRVVTFIPAGATISREVEAELPLRNRAGVIVSFADAAEILLVNFTRVVSLFEVKPRIETVFGIVRQVKAMEDLGRANYPDAQVWAHAVVPASDPLIGELRQEWPRVWSWGISFEPVDTYD